MLYLNLCCASVIKMCLQVSEKPKRALKGVMLSIKLDVIKCFDRGGYNKDIVLVLYFGSGNAQKFSI